MRTRQGYIDEHTKSETESEVQLTEFSCGKTEKRQQKQAVSPEQRIFSREDLENEKLP